MQNAAQGHIWPNHNCVVQFVSHSTGCDRVSPGLRPRCSASDSDLRVPVCGAQSYKDDVTITS